MDGIGRVESETETEQLPKDVRERPNCTFRFLVDFILVLELLRIHTLSNKLKAFLSVGQTSV